MTVIQIPQLLLIAGNGRNSGKTTLACRVITRFCAMVPVVSLKISPHNHKASYGDEADGIAFNIIEEKDRLSSKDSVRMLVAGARRSFFITASDDGMGRVIPTIIELAREGNYIICESGGLRTFAEPGLFVVIHHLNKETLATGTDIKPGLKKLLVFEHTMMTFDGNDFHPGVDNIFIKDGAWKIKNS